MADRVEGSSGQRWGRFVCLCRPTQGLADALHLCTNLSVQVQPGRLFVGPSRTPLGLQESVASN